MDLSILNTVIIEVLSREGLSEELFKSGGLETNSTLDKSRISATASGAKDIAVVLKYLPINVSSI